MVVLALLVGCPESPAPPSTPPPPPPPTTPRGPRLREISQKNAEGRTLLDLCGDVGREELDLLEAQYRAAPDSFLFLSSLTTIDFEQSIEIHKPEAARVIVLNGLTSLEPAIAVVLRDTKASVLVLDGLASLDATSAHWLASWPGKKLFLDGVTRLDPAAAKELATWSGELLSLRALQHIRPETAEALKGFKGKIAISMTPPGKKYTQSIDRETLRKLSKAIVGGRIAEVATYLEGGGTPDANENGTTLLMEACFFKEIEIAKLLLSKGADVNARSQDAQTALCYALHYPFGLDKERDPVKVRQVLKLLLDAKADVNPKDVEKPPLVWGVEFDDATVVKTLMDAGADPKATDSQGYDALIAAINKGNCATVRLLLDAGATVKPTKILPGGMPLHQAVSQPAIEISLFKIRNPDAPAEKIEALRKNAAELIGLLVKAGADVEAPDERKWTPLMSAVNGGELSILQAVIKAGAKVDRKDERGTILHFAADCRRLEEDDIVPLVEQILLEGATDKAATDKDGLTAAQLAEKRGFKKLAALLAP